ncbi:MAG: hypothetical protein RDU83_13615, partial [bacterium]|nr:hypothetical protein [bacterium]
MWEAADQTAKPLISYSGSLPTKLYRYRSVSADNLGRLIEFEILEEGVYLAGLKDLNDPDEGRFLIKFEGSRSQIASYWREAFRSSDPAMTSREAERLADERADEIIR